MLEPEKHDPRAQGSANVSLFQSECGSLRWYVKVSRKGRRIGISEEYGTLAFDAAYEAAVATLGGVLRMRRVKGTVKPDQPERRYLSCAQARRRRAARVAASCHGPRMTWQCIGRSGRLAPRPG
jgi:hypothetical protein